MLPVSRAALPVPSAVDPLVGPRNWVERREGDLLQVKIDVALFYAYTVYVDSMIYQAFFYILMGAWNWNRINNVASTPHLGAVG